MKRITAIVMILAICLSLTACENKLLSVSSLMRPPKLSSDDSLLQSAFETSVSKYENVVMKTPINGKYRSSYIQFDIDKDGREEAIVLYSVPAEGNYVIAELFKYSNDEWISVSSINSNNQEIYEVNFADINGDGCFEILFSWVERQNVDNKLSLSSNSIFSLMIYSYNGGTIDLIKTETYKNFLINDLNNDDSDEILIFNNNFYGSQNLTTLRLISFNDDYSVSYDNVINITSMLEINNIVVDRVISSDKSISRIFVDGAISDKEFITEIIEVNEEDFSTTLPLYHDNLSVHPKTLRNSKIYCMDVDNNGHMDVPTVDVLPYSQKVIGDEFEPLNLIIWSEYDEFGFKVKFKTLLNLKVGHIVFIPEEYIGNITAIYDEENMNLTFYSIDSTGAVKNALFSFRIFTLPDWKEENYNYEILHQNDTYVYSYLIFKSDNYDKYKKFITENFFVL